MTKKRERPKKSSTGLAIFLSGLLLLSGCVSLRQTPENGSKTISGLSAFDGIYGNPSTGNQDAAYASLWNQLVLSDAPDTLDFRKARITLKAIGNDRIRATWLQGDIEKKQVLLKGKFRDNYFVSKHKRTIIPIPLIYGQFSNNQFQLWLDKDSQLHADRLKNNWGWVFLFFAGNDNTSSYQYKRVN